MTQAPVFTMTEIARSFFDACESGAGWAGCEQYCASNATFAAQAEPLADIDTLEGYTEWMKNLLTLLEDGRYEVKSFAADEERNNVIGYGIFSGTHTGEGGPVPPTGKSVDTDYVYVMDFEDGKIRHMTKIWHSGIAMTTLGWV